MQKPPREKWDDIKRRHLKKNGKKMNELTQIMEEENENTVVEIVVGDDGGYDADKVPEGTVI